MANNKPVPTPASLNSDDLKDYREEITAAAEADLETQLELLKSVVADLQQVLHKD